MTVLVVIAMAVAFAALAFPSGYVGYLGLLPILIGIRRFAAAMREREADLDLQPKFEAHGRAILSVVSVTVANGGDNVGTYAPLLARQDSGTILLTCAVFAIMTGVWCVSGKWLVSHPLLGRHIRQWGHRVVPFVLVGIGGYILIRNGLLGRIL
jgi:cadmium resistance protein CadD (predicted permease)